jgi:hypothetical protein
VLRAAVDSVRELTAADRAFAAVTRGPGRYPISVRHGLLGARVVVRQGRGLGGQGVAERRTVVTPSYPDDATITGDYRTIVDPEGLQSVACVPVIGADGVAALLHAGDRRAGGFGDRMLEKLELSRTSRLSGARSPPNGRRPANCCGRPAGSLARGSKRDDATKLREALASIVATCSGVPSAKASSIRLTPRAGRARALGRSGQAGRGTPR